MALNVATLPLMLCRKVKTISMEVLIKHCALSYSLLLFAVPLILTCLRYVCRYHSAMYTRMHKVAHTLTHKQQSTHTHFVALMHTIPLMHSHLVYTYESMGELDTLSRSSLTLMNIYDIGINKAVFDILSVWSGQCSNCILVNVLNLQLYGTPESLSTL